MSQAEEDTIRKDKGNDPKKCDLLGLFWTFFKIGAVTFGGGFAMIPLIKDEVVEKQCWLQEDECIDIFGITQVAPGAIAINTSIFIGNKLMGFPGAVAATLGAVIPSFFIILLIASSFARFQDNPMVRSFFAGVRPGVVALIATAAFRFGKNVLKSGFSYMVSIFGVIGLLFFGIHPIAAILASAFLGFLSGLLVKEQQS